MSAKVYYDTNSKIRKLKEDGSKPVQNKSGLSIIKRGNSKYFVGNIRFPFNRNGKNIPVPIGVFEKEILVDDAISKWHKIKSWSKTNNKNPRLFGKNIIEVSEKTFIDVANDWIENVYKKNVKQRQYEDRKNKINQMLRYIGKDYLISDLEIDKGGRSYISTMLKAVFREGTESYAPVQLSRCRQLLKMIFNYAEDERYIKPNQNPVAKKFQWETGTKRRKSKKNFGKTITSESWGLTPEFIDSVNQNKCNADAITDFATKAHLLMCIRPGVIVRLKWSWYDSKKNQWIIPADTDGLKNKQEDIEAGNCEDHIIPSTSEINTLFSKLRVITGYQEYCFPTLGSTQNPHLGEETINDHFKNIGWKGKLTAQQWRTIITTATQEHSEFEYEIIHRQLGRKEHLQGTRGHYDASTLLKKRREFMDWWSKSLINQGLIL